MSLCPPHRMWRARQSERQYADAEATLRDVEAAARALGLQIACPQCRHSARRSMRPLRRSRGAARRALRRPRCAFSTAGASNLPLWRRAMRSRRRYRGARIRRSRRPDELRHQHRRTRIARSASMPAAFSRARSRPTCRYAVDQVRARHQPQDRQGARPRQCRRRCSPAPTR